jgi:FtsZ-interacting cell division protein ZipA
MSDLLLPLIFLGVLIIAGVVVYNWLQERKLRNQVSNDFIVPQKDVLADDFYIDADAYVDKQLAEISQESKTHDAAHAASNKAEAAVQFNEEVFAATHSSQTNDKPIEEPFIGYGDAFDVPADEAPQAATAAQPELPDAIVQATLREQMQNSQPELPSVIHPQVDLSAILYANDSIGSEALIELNASLIDIGLPFFTHGLDSETKWQLIDANTAQTRFKQVACSVQLADRGGAIARQLLNKFQFAVESMGLEQNAHVEWQGSGDAMQRAADLDKFCIEVDQLISVHLLQGESPIHGTKLRGLAEASGMLLGNDGKFHHQANPQNSANETPLFYMIDSTNHPFTADNLRSNVLKGVTFQIEIPKVSNSEQAFNQMILIAQKMNSSLNTNMVDDLQKPLGDLQIEKIRQQLKVIHATMVARGIMPGSPVSMRLFN